MIHEKGVFERWYKVVIPLLKHYYGTGGDLNIDEIQEVIRTEDCEFGILKKVFLMVIFTRISENK